MATTTLPLWVELFQALATPAIAVGGLAIAIAQVKIAHSKLRHDLFSSRYAIYDALRAYLADVMKEGRTTYARTIEYYREARGADFLFEDNITKYLKTIYEQGVKLTYLNGVTHRGAGDTEYMKAVDEEAEMLKWFADQFDVSLKLFRPAMKP